MSENDTVPLAGGLEGMKELKFPAAMFTGEKPSFDLFMHRVLARLDLAMPKADEREALGRAVHQLWSQWLGKKAVCGPCAWEGMTEDAREMYRYVGAGIAAVIMKTAQQVIVEEARAYIAKAVAWKAAQRPTTGAHGKQITP